MTDTARPAPTPQRMVLANAVAGLSVAGLLIPEAIAYAAMAGLLPQQALAASAIGLLAYSLLGSSGYAVVSPTSSSAVILASAVAALSALTPNPVDAMALSGALVILVGLMFLVAAAARLGHLAAFISRPVLRGFAFALAVTIIIKQLPHLLGSHAQGSGPLPLLLDLLRQAEHWNYWSLGVGLGALLCLRLLKRVALFPGALAVIVLGIGATLSLDLGAHGVALVGSVNLAQLHLAWPQLSRDTWLNAAELAAPLVVILYAESWGSIRTLALRHDETVSADRDLAALGVANLCSGLVQGLPVGAGFSASSANDDAGAQNRWAGTAAALTLVLLTLAAGDWLGRLPQPVLAAVVISALLHALDLRPILVLWRLRRDEVLATVAALAVLALGVLPGMLLAVALSILATLRRFSQSRVSVLGEIGNTRDFVNVQRQPLAVAPPNALVLRPETPLFFANVERVLHTVRELAQQPGAPRTIVLSLEESTDLDSTAVEALGELCAWVALSQRRLLLARVKDEMRDLFQRATPLLSQTPCYWSVADAVAAADPQPPTPSVAPA